MDNKEFSKELEKRTRHTKWITVHRRGRRERREIKGKGELLHNFQFILYHNLRALSVLCGGVNCYQNGYLEKKPIQITRSAVNYLLFSHLLEQSKPLTLVTLVAATPRYVVAQLLAKKCI